MSFRRLGLALVFLCVVTRAAPGIILIDDDTNHTVNTTNPGDNSGWQYEGFFGGYAGTPIAPYFFLAAKHIGGYVGQSFIYHGDTFTTTAYYDDAAYASDGTTLTEYTDLRLWRVNKAFTTYAPLFLTNGDEAGRELHIFGRGTQRGSDITLNGTLRGWANGTYDDVQRWGRNVVEDIVPYTDNPASPFHVWTFLRANFDQFGLTHEAHVSDGDSSGGTFILENGLWCLAGITYGRDELFTGADGSGGFAAAIFNAIGYYTQTGATTYELVTSTDNSNVPTSFYCTLVSGRLDWIEGVIGNPDDSPAPIDANVLPPESFSVWRYNYFTPGDLSAVTVSGPNADPDGDGVSNLLEFAFNLDPTFAEPAVMTAGTGIRGLPLIRVEQVAASDRRLTVEFVRRTTGSGAGVAYAVQFTANPSVPASWQTGGTESVTPINARWERVKVTDTVSVGGTAPVRFARVAVTQM